MDAPARMSDPAARECRCEDCGHVDWVDGPIVAPTVGVVCDACRRSPCPQCDGEMRPTHPHVLDQFHQGATNAPRVTA